MLAQPFSFQERPIADVDRLSSNGKVLATSHSDGSIRLWSIATRQPIAKLSSDDLGQVSTLSVSPDGQFVAASGEQGSICLWRLSADAVPCKLLGNQPKAISLAFSFDGSLLVSGGTDKSVLMWNTETGEQQGERFTKHRAFVSGIALSADGKLLASGDRSGAIYVRNLTDGSVLATKEPGPRPSSVRAMVFSPDNKTLAIAGQEYSSDDEREDGSIHLWKVDTLKAMGDPILGFKGNVYAIAFSPDSKTLYSADSFGNVMLWDVASRQPIGLPLRYSDKYLTSLAVSSDGKELFSTGADQTVMVWPLDEAKWREIACSVANRNLTEKEWGDYVGVEPYRVTCPIQLPSSP